VNTAGCGFTSTPLYFTSMGGASSHWTTRGATSIYSATPTGFRVYIYSPGMTPAVANQHGWQINWQATPNNLRQPALCTGQTPSGATQWQQYSADGIFLDVSTAGCGFSSTPVYFTSMGGWSNHWTSTGATSLYSATPTGFRVYIFSPGMTPSLANQNGWNINWQASLNNLRQGDACTGQTPLGATPWQQYSADGIFLDVSTSGCPIQGGQYLTSIGGWSNHWTSTGASSLYWPTSKGFRVYIFSPGMTPALANQNGWNISWNRR
jgi:hypothetical protein